MQALGTFDGNTLAKVPGIINALTDDQVALLAQYYYLTRSKTEQDAYLYSLQQQGYADQQVNEAKADIGDLLTTMNNQIEACYAQFTPMPEPVQYVAQVCYASVPGWCCQARCYVPEWYYANGCYVGPCFNAIYAGPWTVPVCNAYFNHRSHFYSVYHNVARNTYINHSVRLAQQHATWLRNHGDWHNTLAHDRLLHQSATAYRTTPGRLTAARTNRPTTIHNIQTPRTTAKPAHIGTPQVRQQRSKPQVAHAAVAHASNVQRHVATPHVSHVSAHASRPAVHASHPTAVAHVQSHARPASHVQAPARPAAHAQVHARPAAHPAAHVAQVSHAKRH